MKVTVEFDLKEEKDSYEVFMQAQKMHDALRDLDLLLRAMDKYESFELMRSYTDSNASQYVNVSDLRRKFFDITSEIHL